MSFGRLIACAQQVERHVLRWPLAHPDLDQTAFDTLAEFSPPDAFAVAAGRLDPSQRRRLAVMAPLAALEHAPDALTPETFARLARSCPERALEAYETFGAHRRLAVDAALRKLGLSLERLRRSAA